MDNKNHIGDSSTGKENNKVTMQSKALSKNTLHSHFLDLCREEVKAGNRLGTHFNKIGWANIVKKFQVVTGKEWDRTKLQNHWDVTLKDWLLWNEMIRNETGLRWDFAKQTIDAPNVWWENKIARNPSCEKFREQGLRNYDILRELFSDITTTSSVRSWAQIFGFLPLREDEIDDVADNASTYEAENEQEKTISDSESTSILLKRSGNSLGSEKKRTKRSSTATKLSKQIDRICDVLERRSTATSIRNENSGASITDVMSIMENMTDIEHDTNLYIFAAQFFMKRDNREMFVALNKPVRQLAWLRIEQAKKN